MDGRKAWVTNGILASSYLVVARVERDGSTGDTAVFIVDAASPGLRIGPLERTLGLRSALVIHLDLDRCVLPGSMVLGDGVNGLKLALDALQASRVGVAAQSVGIARAAMELAAAGERSPAGGPELSSVAARVEAANLMMLRAAWLVDQGGPARRRPRWPNSSVLKQRFSCPRPFWTTLEQRPAGKLIRHRDSGGTPGSPRFMAAPRRSSAG